jgi:hypothetical protein
MCKVPAVAFSIWIVLLFAMNIAGIISYKRFLKHLSENHPEHWHSLGSPKPFEDEPEYRPHGFFSYFYGRKYSELGSSEMTALGDSAVQWPKRMLVSLLVLAAIALPIQFLAEC